MCRCVCARLCVYVVVVVVSVCAFVPCYFLLLLVFW